MVAGKERYAKICIIYYYPHHSMPKTMKENSSIPDIKCNNWQTNINQQSQTQLNKNLIKDLSYLHHICTILKNIERSNVKANLQARWCSGKALDLCLGGTWFKSPP
jgi:hypothetical protein